MRPAYNRPMPPASHKRATVAQSQARGSSRAARATVAQSQARRSSDTAGAAAVTKSDIARPLLGEVALPDFFARFWHKDALLVRHAMPYPGEVVSPNELFALAQREDVESRLVIRDQNHWTLRHGPFRRRELSTLPPRNWTLLVQGVNLHVPRAEPLLRQFEFLPYARLDDLMVSYAAPGGGVGPHYDSYDVFLVQGLGRRRWRYGRQKDIALKPGLPLKILKRFTPEHDHVLQPGDILYLPPEYAHDGVAVDACTTYSIGLRAPAFNELAVAFLDFLRDEIDLPGRYADPDLQPTRHPAKVDRSMQTRCAQVLARIDWNRDTVARFLGRWLSEPKPSVFFEPPSTPLTLAAFRYRIATKGVRLSPRTQMLYDADRLFVNGNDCRLPDAGAEDLRRLGDRRLLSNGEAASLPSNVSELLHDWYRDGFLYPADT